VCSSDLLMDGIILRAVGRNTYTTFFIVLICGPSSSLFSSEMALDEKARLLD